MHFASAALLGLHLEWNNEASRIRVDRRSFCFALQAAGPTCGSRNYHNRATRWLRPDHDGLDGALGRDRACPIHDRSNCGGLSVLDAEGYRAQA